MNECTVNLQLAPSVCYLDLALKQGNGRQVMCKRSKVSLISLTQTQKSQIFFLI